jgi:hypothetical protein
MQSVGTIESNVKVKSRIKFFILILLSLIDVFCYGQVDTISVNKKNIHTEFLKEGSSQFLAWYQDPKTKFITNHGIGERTIRFVKINDRNVIIVTQHRHYNDSSTSKYVYTVSDRKTFQTLYDYTFRIQSGAEGFNYTDKGVTGADTVKNNVKASFNYTFPDVTPFCSELNVETMCSLPLKKLGQKFVFSLYEPGLAYPPEYHLVEITGSENIAAVDDTHIDCWIVKLSYDKDNYEYWWISKQRHEFLKLESFSPTGNFYKVKLFNSAPGRF